MEIRDLLKVSSLLVLLVLPIQATTQENWVGGGRILPVESALPSVKFNLLTDLASVYLEKAVLYKHNGWFTKDKQLVVGGKLTINSKKKNEFDEASSLTITRVYRFDVSAFGGNRIEIPLKSLPLLDTYRLNGSNYYITSIVLDIYLAKKKEKTDVSKVLDIAISASKKVPIPGNPLAQYASVFGDTFSEIIDEAVKESTDAVPFASFGLRFLGGGEGGQYTEKTGIHAIVLGGDGKVKGVIPLSDFKGDNLRYDEQNGLMYQGERLQNNYLVLRVVSSIDQFAAAAVPEQTLDRIAVEAPAAVALSQSAGIATPVLQEIAAGTVSSDTIQVTAMVEAAIKELNAIRGSDTLVSLEAASQAVRAAY